MDSLTHRERVLISLNHQEPDRVPLDFGGIATSEIVARAYANLTRHLGFRSEMKETKGSARTVIPEEALLKRFDIDTRQLKLGDFKNKPRRIIDTNCYVDPWGAVWKRAPDSFFLNVDGPFKNSDPTIEDLERFQWPDPDDPGLYEGLKEKAEFLRKSSDFAIVLNVAPVSGILKQCFNLRGFAELLMDFYENPGFASRLLDIITDLHIQIAVNALNAAGDNVDILFFPDDLGHQQSTFMSPGLYRELIKPRHKRFVEALKSRSHAKILLHSDGAIYGVIQDLIEIGIDALNPVQVSARDMDPAVLKREFGDRLSFWGAVDTQQILPFESPREVREEVRRIIDLLGQGGGYVLTSVQSIQEEVPPENIVALFEEGRSYGVYSRRTRVPSS